MVVYLPCYNQSLYDQLLVTRMRDTMLKYYSTELVDAVLNDHTGDFAITGNVVLQALVGPLCRNGDIDMSPSHDMDIVSNYSSQTHHHPDKVVSVLFRNDKKKLIQRRLPDLLDQRRRDNVVSFVAFEDTMSYNWIDSIVIGVSISDYVKTFDYGFCRNYFIPGESPALISLNSTDVIKKTSTLDVVAAYLALNSCEGDSTLLQPFWYRVLQ